MIKTKTLLICSTLFLAACSSSSKVSDKTNTVDSSGNASAQVIDQSTMVGKLSSPKNVKLGEPINVKFSVHNTADTSAKFCKWHTPFERLMSKYLDVTLSDGTEVDYKGPMAKRIMPPPADSYISLKAKDSTSVDFNLLDAYSISKAGTYTVKYNSSNISGVVVKDSIMITVGN
ncbi:protease [Pedobacter frigidisoli]|uniref:Protease n=1 Tax=Pedobacter frigidisoli TaxID=2530455 RepID=A0A4R0P7M0_9SPHI|nr:protease [Pedobacter frigidisoli]TCD10528.1 protease [Pedobacter frigidisoli]